MKSLIFALIRASKNNKEFGYLSKIEESFPATYREFELRENSRDGFLSDDEREDG